MVCAVCLNIFLCYRLIWSFPSGNVTGTFPVWWVRSLQLWSFRDFMPRTVNSLRLTCSNIDGLWKPRLEQEYRIINIHVQRFCRVEDVNITAYNAMRWSTFIYVIAVPILHLNQWRTFPCNNGNFFHILHKKRRENCILINFKIPGDQWVNGKQ